MYSYRAFFSATQMAPHNQLQFLSEAALPAHAGLTRTYDINALRNMPSGRLAARLG